MSSLEGRMTLNRASERETSPELYGAPGKAMWEWDALVIPVNERFVLLEDLGCSRCPLMYRRGSDHWYLIVVDRPGKLLQENSGDVL